MVSPQEMSSPTRQISFPLTYTVPDPVEATPSWQFGPQQCIIQWLPTLWTGLPLTNTFRLPSLLRRGGKQSCPQDVSPNLTTVCFTGVVSSFLCMELF